MLIQHFEFGFSSSVYDWIFSLEFIVFLPFLSVSHLILWFQFPYVKFVVAVSTSCLILIVCIAACALFIVLLPFPLSTLIWFTYPNVTQLCLVFSFAFFLPKCIHSILGPISFGPVVSNLFCATDRLFFHGPAFNVSRINTKK